MPNTQSRVIRETPNMSRQTSVLEGMRIWEEGYKKLHWKCVANAREVYGKCSCPRLTKALEMVLVQAWAEKSWNLSLPGFGLGTPPQKKTTLSFNHDALWNSTLKKKRFPSFSFLISRCIQLLFAGNDLAGSLPAEFDTNQNNAWRKWGKGLAVFWPSRKWKI